MKQSDLSHNYPNSSLLIPRPSERIGSSIRANNLRVKYLPHCFNLGAFNPIVYSSTGWIFATMKTESKRLYTFSANRYLALEMPSYVRRTVICLLFLLFFTTLQRQIGKNKVCDPPLIHLLKTLVSRKYIAFTYGKTRMCHYIVRSFIHEIQQWISIIVVGTYVLVSS